MITLTSRRDLAAEKYCVKTDGEFEFAKAWREVKEIHSSGWDACLAELQPAIQEAVRALENINGYLYMESRDSKSPYANGRANVARLVACEEAATKALAILREAGLVGENLT